MTAATTLCALGHCARTAQLASAGVSQRSLAALIASGVAQRARKGLIVCAHLPAVQRHASMLGARVDCVSVLRDNGVWAAGDYRLHVRFAPQAHASIATEATHVKRSLATEPQPPAQIPRNSGTVLSDPRRGIVRHWAERDERFYGAADAASVSIMEALHQAMGCLAPDDVIAALESARYRNLITGEQLGVLVETAPRRLRTVLRELDAGAQSGIETLVRLGFRRLGYRVVPQAFIPGVGRVDNLIEDCVAVESDGRSFHESSLETDYDRDMACEYLGVRVLRVSPRIVLTRWEWLVEAVGRMVSDAQTRGAR